MLMDPGLDTGPMLLQQKTAIDENEDITSLHDRMAALGAELLAETLRRLQTGDITPQPQSNDNTCYASMLKKEDGLINWQKDARAIHDQVRGMSVWPGAYTFLGEQVLKIFRTRVGSGSGIPGTVLTSSKGQLEVACQSGSLFIQELQLSGKKRLDIGSFLAGFQIAEGALLGSDSCGDAPS
jgi:methionyl-tRNA formyltransferase